MKTNFETGLLTVDYGWGEFHLGRNETDPPDQRLRQTVHSDLHTVAKMNQSKLGLRDKRTHFDVLRWQQHNDRTARSDPIPWR